MTATNTPTGHEAQEEWDRIHGAQYDAEMKLQEAAQVFPVEAPRLRSLSEADFEESIARR